MEEVKEIKKAEVVEVIKVRAIVGNGTKENPVREVIQYWEKSGRKIAEMGSYEEAGKQDVKTTKQ